MSFASEITTALRALVPLIVVRTLEEQRAERTILEGATAADWDCVFWDLAEGTDVSHAMNQRTRFEQVTDERQLLTSIGRLAEEAPNEKLLFVLKDFHPHMLGSSPFNRRKIRNLAQSLSETNQSLLLLVPPEAELPEELADETMSIDLPLPDRDDMKRLISDMLSGNSDWFKVDLNDIKVDLDERSQQSLAEAAIGLSEAQARRALIHAIRTQGARIDASCIEVVRNEKKSVVKESEALEFLEPTVEAQRSVGGLEQLKSWLAERENALTQKARDYGLPAPKGIALVGIPGTGKSLSASMVAAAWGYPLLRLDVGALFGTYVGQSEARARRALDLAESIAPCVLWIDEIEKSLGQGDSDGGTSQRVFATILTWMQEKTAPVFVVATANNVERLPPELLRRGRFDEIFFLDLPTTAEREQIIGVHLIKFKRDPSDFDIQLLASVSEGHVGAELEQSLIDAMHAAFSDGCREVTTADIERAIGQTVPLSRSQRTAVTKLRSWLHEGRARSASFSESAEAARNEVKINFDD